MPKYCPRCESEFTDDMKNCPADKRTLVDHISLLKNDFFVDIYAAADEIEAERITSYLASIGIRSREALSGISQLPVVSDTRFIISVQQSMRDKALDALKQARQDTIISQNGSFL